MTQTVQLRDVTEGDLAIFFKHQLDSAATHMAAFTAKEPADRDAFAAHWTKILGDDNIKKKAILFAGRVIGHVVRQARGVLPFACSQQSACSCWAPRPVGMKRSPATRS